MLEIVGIAGSLRRASFNRRLLQAAVDLAPAPVHISVFDLSDIPLYNADVEAAGDPPPVARLKDAVRTADGLLIASPEYNHGVSGVLKNTIDWLSRPPRTSVLANRPVAIMGASTGVTGTARGQQQLRLTLLATQMNLLTRPEILVGRAPEKFDGDGRLIDQPTRELVTKLLEGLAAHILGKMP
jgi:chromate reductase